MHRKWFYQRIYKGSVTSIVVMLVCTIGFAKASAAHDKVTGVQILVNTTGDDPTSIGDCSLREALQAANTDTSVDACPAGNGADTIVLPKGIYTLSIPGINEDDGLKGDLDIYSDMTISGAGMNNTIIDGGLLDRVFHITGDYAVQIREMTIQKGNITESGAYGGGGILNQSNELSLNKLMLLENQAEDGNGGGLDNVGVITLTEVSIQGNTAARGGGIFSDGSLNLRGVAIFGNSATISGGGIDNSGSADIRNVTISGNDALDGGGIYNDGEPFYILNTTFYENSTAVAHYQGSIRFRNTIVANSTAGDNCTGLTKPSSDGNNLDSGSACNFTSENDLNDTDPLLDVLQDNKGSTWTHALLEGSPAIDKGDNLDCPTTDQRGAHRPADGNGDDSKVCDIGAFEHSGSFPSLIFLPITSRH